MFRPSLAISLVAPPGPRHQLKCGWHVSCSVVLTLWLVGSAVASAHEKTAAELAAEDRAIDAQAGRENAKTDPLAHYPGERRRVRPRQTAVRLYDGGIPLPAGGIAV